MTPANVRIGDETIVIGNGSWGRFRSIVDDAVVLGNHSTMEEVHFAIGRNGRLRIGDYCYFTHAILLCDFDVRIGSYVIMGFNAVIADSDFHPIEPALRVLDALACSPLAGDRARPPIEQLPVVIEDDVWIGPNATILKGVQVGAGAIVEAGAVVTTDVPSRVRVQGNPARIVGVV
ncbi:MAG: transferase hexapeptide repeat containing protein [Acidimicrobiales bacterium]|jgi:acetyltransferase-like isoleucine patch superfamily enzyme|nr:transferase hexapeptide repeat containing protein [Acidimicrobiales bacterium]